MSDINVSGEVFAEDAEVALISSVSKVGDHTFPPCEVGEIRLTAATPVVDGDGEATESRLDGGVFGFTKTVSDSGLFEDGASVPNLEPN